MSPRSDIRWKKFVSRYWEREPAFLPALFDPPIANAEELFGAIVRMPSRGRADRLWIAGKPQPRRGDDFKLAPLDAFGPRDSDLSLAGFFERSQSGFKGRPFGINIHHLQLAWPELWFRFRDFMSGLIDETGELPTQEWDIDTFFGTYESTPFGIHRDNASVFAIGVSGRRAYYFWPNEAFVEGDPVLATPDLEKMAPRFDEATRVEIGPGDAVYWPSSHWHVVVSEGEPSAVIQLSAYFGARMSDLIAEQARQLLAKKLGGADFARVFPDSPMPGVLADSQAALLPAELSDALLAFWLKRRSADGFAEIPTPDARTQLNPDVPIRLRNRRSLRWARGSSQQLLVAANGHFVDVEGEADGELVLNQLASGASISSGQQPHSVLSLLETLNQFRVFETAS